MSGPRAGALRRVVAVVAAKDSASSIGATVRALSAVAPDEPVVVVDDGSTDATAEEARRAGARVITLPVNVGKGGAVAAGVAATPGAGIYLLVDGDVAATAAATTALLGPVVAGTADMTVGILPSAGRQGGWGLVRRLSQWGIRRATGSTVRAPLSGQRAVDATLLRRLELAPRFGLETGLTLDALRAGAQVLEVPVAMDHHHRGRGMAGVRHRARQGTDILRALWPRLTTPALRIAVLTLALVLTAGATLWSARRAEPSSRPFAGRAGRVVIFGVPRLAWDDLGPASMPSLDRIIHRGALGAMTVRTLSRRPNLTEGYATLGAGSRVEAAPGSAVARVGSGARPQEGAAAANGPEDSAASASDEVPEVPDARETLTRNRGRHVASLPGALGDALHRAGRRTAVVGAAPAVAVMDRAGAIDAGAVNADIATAPGATLDALSRADVVIVDTGELERSGRTAPGADTAPRSPERRAALRAVDDALGVIAASLAPDVRLLVVSVVPPAVPWRLTPVVLSGAGIGEGELVSPSTRRRGLVTLTDVAPTVLASLGVPTPRAMIGAPLRYQPGRADPASMARLDRLSAYRERVYLPIVIGFVAVQALVYGLAIAGFARGVVRGRTATVLRALALAFAAFPLATFLFRAVPGAPGLGAMAFLVIGAIDAVLVRAVWRLRAHPLQAIGWVLAATLVLLVVDVATGSRLQQASIMGYSPHTASRFFGIGNSAFAVLAACTILAAAVHLERAPRRGEALVTVAGLFALVIVLDGAPSLGDDVGGILTLVPVFGIALLAFAGRRLSWRTVAAVVALTAAVVGLATAIDLARPPDARTHLGRLVADMGRDGVSPLRTVIARKTATNIRVLRSTVWAWMVPIIALFMLHLLAVQRRGAELLPPRSPRRTGVIAALAAGLVGCVLNDSGVVVTALVFVYVGSFLTVLAIPTGLR